LAYLGKFSTTAAQPSSQKSWMKTRLRMKRWKGRLMKVKTVKPDCQISPFPSENPPERFV
jgi:hypothetical protein